MPRLIAPAPPSGTYARMFAMPTPTGVAATDQAALESVIAQAEFGGQVWFREGTYALNAAALVETPGITFRGIGPLTVLEQETWGQPVFDVLNADDTTITDMRLVHTGERTLLSGASVRDGGVKTYASGIWAAADRLHVARVQVDGFTSAVRLTNWDDATQTATGYASDCVIEDLVVANVDWGFVGKGLRRLRLRNVRGSYAATSGSADPVHLVYIAEGQASVDVDVADCWAHDSVGGHAYSFKNITGGSIRNMNANATEGLFTVQSCTDVDFDGFQALAQTQSSDLGLIYTTSDNTRVRFRSKGSIVFANDDGYKSVRLDGTDVVLQASTLRVTRAGGSTSAYEVVVQGTRCGVDDVTIEQLGAVVRRNIGLNAGSGHVVRRPTIRGGTHGVTVVSGATDCVIDYDPSLIDVSASGASRRAVSVGDASTRLSRRHKVAAFTTVSGSAAVGVYADEATNAEVNVTDATNITISNPVSAAHGYELVYSIRNNSGGAMGTVTFGSAFVTTGAFTAPASTKRRLIAFRYDVAAAKWYELWRSTADL